MVGDEGGGHVGSGGGGSGGGWTGGEAGGGLAAVGHPLPATFLERSRTHFDECPLVADALLRLLPAPKADSGQVVVDLDPGTGFYLSYLQQNGVNVTGLDADGELSAVLVDADLREMSAYEEESVRASTAATLPRGSVLLLQVPNPVPPGLSAALVLMGRLCTQRLILGWPAGVSERGLLEGLWLHGLHYNAQASAWLQARAHAARHNTHLYSRFSNVQIRRCQGSAVFLVFDKAPPLSAETFAMHAAGVEGGTGGEEGERGAGAEGGGGGGDGAGGAGGPGLVWPEHGAVLPELGVVDVEWRAEARGDLSRRVRERDDGRARPDAWHVKALGACAVVLVDGAVRGRGCGGAAVVTVPPLAPGAHSVRVVPVLVVPELPGGAAGAQAAWARDATAPVLESLVWVSRVAAGGGGGEEARGAASDIEMQVEVVGVWDLAVTAQVTLSASSAAARARVSSALRACAVPFVLALDVAPDAPSLRFTFALAAEHLVTASESVPAAGGGAIGRGEALARRNVTVLAVGADERGRVPVHVSVWGRGDFGFDDRLEGHGAQRGTSSEDARELLLLARDADVVLRGGSLEQRGAGADGAGGGGGRRLEGEGGREKGGNGDSDENADKDNADKDAEYAAATEALFCRAADLSVHDLLPLWLAFLSSGAWGGRGGLRASGRRGEEHGDAWGGGRWEKLKLGGSEWGLQPGARRLSNVLVSTLHEDAGHNGSQPAIFALGPLRVLELVGPQWPRGAALEVSFHVRSLGSGSAGEGAAGRDGMETMDWLVVRAVSRDAVVPASISRVASGQYHVRSLLRLLPPRVRASARARERQCARMHQPCPRLQHRHLGSRVTRRVA